MRDARHSLIALAVLGLCWGTRPVQAETHETTQDFLNYWTQYFQEHPRDASVVGENEENEGDGFMPFNRYKDFVNRRFPNLAETGGNMPAGVRWKAYEQLLDMEETQGRSGETWFSIGPTNLAGRCLAIAVHPTNPDIVYAGFASAGIWKTTDGGNTWVPLGDTLPTMAVSCIEIDRGNPNRIWIGTGEGWGNVDAVGGTGVLVSTDAGLSWNPTGLSYAINNAPSFYELEYNPTSGVLIAAGPGLWRSTDQGATFTQLYNLGTWHDVEMKRGSTNTWFATSRAWSGYGFYVSTDDGANWTVTSTGITPVNQNRFALSDADPNTIYWSMNTTGSVMKIYKSTDGGLAWNLVFTGSHFGSQGWYNFSVDVAQSNTTTVFSGGVEFYRSTNSGASFSNWSGSIHVDHHATAWAPSDPNVFWVGSDGGVWKSTNAGQTFTSKNAGLVTTQFYAMASSLAQPTRALGGLQDNGTWQYDGTLNWSNDLGGDGFQCEADPVQPNTLYGELYYGRHYRTTNNGTWLIKGSGIATDSGPWETPTWLDLADHNWLWAGHNNELYRTTNQMNSWTPVAGFAPTGESRSIAQSPVDTNVMVCLQATKVYLSTDHGVTWTDKTNGLASGNTFSDVAFDPSDANIIYVTLSTFNSTSLHQVNKSTDQGASWFAVDAGLPEEPINAIEIHPDHPGWVFVTSDLGVYVSFDGAATWQPFNNGLPRVVCSDIRINAAENFIRISTHGRGFWEVDISNLGPSAVGETKPLSPLMLKVFGNPASDKTTLHFGMREAGNYTVGIFDANGRKVLPVKEGFMYATVENAEVNVSTLPAGVYFARLDAKGTSITQKLVIQH